MPMTAIRSQMDADNTGNNKVCSSSPDRLGPQERVHIQLVKAVGGGEGEATPASYCKTARLYSGLGALRSPEKD